MFHAASLSEFVDCSGSTEHLSSMALCRESTTPVMHDPRMGEGAGGHGVKLCTITREKKGRLEVQCVPDIESLVDTIGRVYREK